MWEEEGEIKRELLRIKIGLCVLFLLCNRKACHSIHFNIHLLCARYDVNVQE